MKTKTLLLRTRALLLMVLMLAVSACWSQDVGLELEKLGEFHAERVEVVIDRDGNSEIRVVARGKLPSGWQALLRDQGFRLEPATRKWHKRAVWVTTNPDGLEVVVRNGEPPRERSPRLDLSTVLAGSQVVVVADFSALMAFFRFSTKEAAIQAMDRAHGMWIHSPPVGPPSHPSQLIQFRTAQIFSRTASIMRSTPEDQVSIAVAEEEQ